MIIKYLGHSCFLLEINNKKLIFDPFISPNELAKNIDINTIQVDYVIVSHGHEDHIADVELITNNSNATLVSNFEITTYFEKKGIKTVHPMNTGGVWNFDFGKIKCVPALHSSSFPDGTYGGNPLGFIITFVEDNVEKNIYYAGDTAYFSDMKLLEEEFNHIDFAFLPVGDNFTMGIKDAVKAANIINADVVIPMHYDTFGYIKIDHKELADSFSAFNLIKFNIGERKKIN